MSNLSEFCNLRRHYQEQLDGLDHLADDIKHYAAKERERIAALGDRHNLGHRIVTGDQIIRLAHTFHQSLDYRIGYLETIGQRINEIIREDEVNGRHP